MLTATPLCIGDSVGRKIEDDFTVKAKQAGLSDEEARSAFNSNMTANALLSDAPAEFAKEHGRRWLVAAYEAGDVVLHKPHMVRCCRRRCLVGSAGHADRPV